MTSDDQLLKDFAQGFAAIPHAKEAFFSAAHDRSNSGLFGVYTVVTECVESMPAVQELNARISDVNCYRSGRLAALITVFAPEMRAEGLKFSIGVTQAASLVKAIKYYNDMDQIPVPDNDSDSDSAVIFKRPQPFNPTGKSTMSNFFEKFANKAVATPTLIFGKITEDMDDGCYLAAIRRLNSEIAALDDINNCEKVDDKVLALQAELAAVIKIYNDSDA